MKLTYRGFDITKHENGGYVISKDSTVISSQPSLEFAHKFIDEYLRQQRQDSVRMAMISYGDY